MTLALVLASMSCQMVHGFRSSVDMDISQGFVPHVPDKSDKVFWIDCSTHQAQCHQHDDGSYDAYEPVWHARLHKNGVTDDEIEAFDDMLDKRKEAAAPWEAERLDQKVNGVTYLKECSRMGKKAVPDEEEEPNGFCLSPQALKKATYIVRKYLPRDGTCLPDERAYGIHQDQYHWRQSTTLMWLYDEDAHAATEILAQGIVDETCVQVPVTALEWPQDCAADVALELRHSSHGDMYELICSGPPQKYWQTEEDQDEFIKDIPASCRTKIGTFVNLPEADRAREFAALSEAVRPIYCKAEEAAAAPGCAPASDLQEELCAREMLAAWGHDMRKACRGDGTDFAGKKGTRPSFIEWQDAYLFMARQIRGRGVKSIEGADLRRLEQCAALSTKKLLSHALAAYRCACPGPLPEVDAEMLKPARADSSGGAVETRPCFGIEGETSGVQLHTGQKPVLQLVAESMCNPAYPLFQVTGDMGDDWKSMELITGPVPAVRHVLLDMYTLYHAVFEAMFEFSGDLLTDGASADAKKDKRHAGVPVINPTFLQYWDTQLVPVLLKKFSVKGLLPWVSGQGKLKWTVSGTSAQKGQGKPRIGVDYPVAVQRHYGDLDIGMQTTFELPLDFGSAWLSSVKPLFVGTSERDYVEVFVGAVHGIAEALGAELKAQESELSQLLVASREASNAAAESAGIFQTILHYMAHYALVLASDDSDLALHGDDDIDITLLSCNVVRKNSFILNPRFGLKDLMEAFKDALKADQLEALGALVVSAFHALAADEARWSQLKRNMWAALVSKAQRDETALPELCVKQEGLVGCAEFLGMRDKSFMSSTVGRASYTMDKNRYINRLFLSLRQTVLAAGEKKFGVVRGCGHNIPPVFRQVGGMKFCRFEDRGQGRLATLLDLSVDRKQNVVRPEEIDRVYEAFGGVTRRSSFNPYELAEDLLVKPVMESGRTPE